MRKIELITEFLKKDEPIAVIGVSRNIKKFGRQVYEKLKLLDYNLHPINSRVEKIGTEKCFNDIESLPKNVKKLIILTPKEFTDEIIAEASKKGITHIWVQQMCDTDHTLRLANELKINLIINECVLMFADPKGIHKVHRIIKQVLGTLPN